MKKNKKLGLGHECRGMEVSGSECCSARPRFRSLHLSVATLKSMLLSVVTLHRELVFFFFCSVCGA